MRRRRRRRRRRTLKWENANYMKRNDENSVDEKFYRRYQGSCAETDDAVLTQT